MKVKEDKVLLKSDLILKNKKLVKSFQQKKYWIGKCLVMDLIIFWYLLYVV